MSDPSPYIVSYSFGGYQANNPSSPLPGLQVDNELAAVAASIGTMVAAIMDVRRSDGKLQNGIVTFDALHESLQFLVDPTNGQLVAAAVASAQAAATAASGSATTAAGQAAAATASAVAAAASASGVNLSLYLSKAGNLAGIGNADTARGTLLGMKVDGSDATKRFAAFTSINGVTVTDWNAVLENGWYSGSSAANQPSYITNNHWLVQVAAQSAVYVVQTAYPFTLPSSGFATALPFRRYGYDNGGGVVTWTPWYSVGTLPIGTSILVNDSVAPPGFLKENGALVSRTTYAQLWAFANASGALVSEATWSATHSGAFSTGDLSTTFRLPDSRGEFIRSYDDSRGVDSGRQPGQRQADSLKDHTHSVPSPQNAGGGTVYGSGSFPNYLAGPVTSGSPSTGAAAETRPRSIPKLVCIKAY